MAGKLAKHGAGGLWRPRKGELNVGWAQLCKNQQRWEKLNRCTYPESYSSLDVKAALAKTRVPGITALEAHAGLCYRGMSCDASWHDCVGDGMKPWYATNNAHQAEFVFSMWAHAFRGGASPRPVQHYYDLVVLFGSLPDSNETVCMLNHPRRRTLRPPTAAPTATQLRVF